MMSPVTDRVPPGFNEAVDRRAGALAQLVGRYVLPVFCLDAETAPVFEGSAVAVRVGSAFYLVSAAHVFDATVNGGIHLLREGDPQRPLANPAWVTITRKPSLRSDDTLDLGYVELTSEEVASIGESAFISVELAWPPAAQRWYTRYLVLGYPAKRQRRDDDSLVYHLRQTRYTAPELNAGKYQNAGLSRDDNVALMFDPRRITNERGQGGKPGFAGMSGGGIWEFDLYTEYSQGNPPRLIGFLAGPSPRNKKTIFGSRLSVFFRLLAARVQDPDAAG